MPLTKIYTHLFIAIILAISVTSNAVADTFEHLTLQQAIELAVANNTESKISNQSATIAELQYQEALSARWPSLALQGMFQRRDEPPKFIFPSSTIPLGGLSGAISAALGGAPVPSSIVVPEQKVKLFNRDTTIASLKMMYPLYTGGKISSIIEQAGLGKDIAQEEFRRTHLQVIRDVKRYYYAAQLTENLYQTATKTVNLLSSTRDLTKSLYEGGSETLNKLDYLKTDLAVSYAQSIQADFAAKHQSALAALANTMGVSWSSKVTLVDGFENSAQKNVELAQLVKQANVFNPQVGMLKLAVKAADAKIDEEKSGFLPQVAITADTTHINNSYDSGLTNDTNRNSWTIGVGVSLPLFDGWRTTSRVSAAKVQYAQMQERQKLVEEGIATQLKNLFIELDGARQQVAISEKSSATAEENLDLTSRAFQIGASKPEDVIQSHMLNAIIKGNLYKAQHDQLLKLAEIEYILGAELQ